jgi:hypothetical protein
VNYAHTVHGPGFTRPVAPAALLGRVYTYRKHKCGVFCMVCLRVDHNWVAGAGPRSKVAENLNDDLNAFVSRRVSVEDIVKMRLVRSTGE